MKKSLNIVTLTLGASLAAVIPAHAQLIASDGFNYTPGSGVLATEGTGGTGWSGSWTDKGNLTTIASGSLSYTDGSGNTLATSGNSVIEESSTSSSTEPERVLPSTFGTLATANTADPDTIWVSYLWQGLNTTGSGAGLYRQSTVMFLQGATASAGSGKEFLDVGMPNIAAGSTVNPDISLFAANGITSPGPTVPSSTAPLDSGVAGNNGLTDFVLVEVTGSFVAGTGDTVNVWIDPTLTGSTPTGAPQLTYSGQDMSAVNAIRFQSGGINATYGSVSGEEQVDELNIGDTPADVEPIVAAPEPAGISLAVVGGLAALGFTRKRS
jgi:hypothetical protein